MRLPTRLRQLRLDQATSLGDAEERTGISRGTLSLIETGRALPRDSQVGQLELVYGPPERWYEPAILLHLQRDNGDADE